MVVMIIMVLISIASVSLSVSRRKARDSKRVRDIQSVATALQVYYMELGSYPIGVANFAALSTVLANYMREFPIPPAGSTNIYGYSNACASTPNQGYQMWADLEGSEYRNSACGCSGNNFCICEGICTAMSGSY